MIKVFCVSFLDPRRCRYGGDDGGDDGGDGGDDGGDDVVMMW